MAKRKKKTPDPATFGFDMLQRVIEATALWTGAKPARTSASCCAASRPDPARPGDCRSAYDSAAVEVQG
jgi:hypothetical protein